MIATESGALTSLNTPVSRPLVFAQGRIDAISIVISAFSEPV
jgi:hypothetical protein